jgi:predicted RNase H-like nuclease (RuvC/YqgF family)
MAEIEGSLRTETNLIVDPETAPAEVIIDNVDSTASVILNESGMTPRGAKRRSVDKNSDEYRRRRERNNVAVKRSRQKTRMRVQATESRVKDLEDENKDLKQKIELLTKELTVLKSLFITSGTEINPKLISAADVITKVIRGESIPGPSGQMSLLPGVASAIGGANISVPHT